jgi:hypothetical protein
LLPRLPWLGALCLLAVTLAPVAACRPTGVDDLRSAPDEEPIDPPVPAYATHVLLYGNALAHLDQQLLEPFSLIILEAQTLELLEDRYQARALLSSILKAPRIACATGRIGSRRRAAGQ